MNQTTQIAAQGISKDAQLWIVLGAAFIGLILLVLVFILLKNMYLKNKHAKESMNHIYCLIKPKAGKLIDKLEPIEQVGGVSIVRLPVKAGTKDKDGKEVRPVYILGEGSDFPIDYPMNKSKQVQVTCQGIMLYEGSVEPLSNTTGKPIMNAQLLGNLLDGVGTSTAEAMRKSQEESNSDKAGKSKGLLWIYVLLFGILGVGIAAVVMDGMMIKVIPSLPQMMERLNDVIRQSLGLPAQGLIQALPIGK